MKVGFVTNQLSYSFYGGGDVQFTHTIEELKRMGVEATLFTPYHKLQKKDFDLIHIFGPTRFPFESSNMASYAKNQGIKVACSTIFWLPYPDGPLSRLPYMKGFDQATIRMVKLAISAGKSMPLNGLASLRRLFHDSDVLLPNTSAEALLLQQIFDIPKDKVRVIPNAVDPVFAKASKGPFVEKYGLDDFILFTGRIEKRKNVLGLIRAFKKTSLNTKLVIIGKIAEYEYYKKCKAEANRNVVFIPEIGKDDQGLLRSAYKAARVMALPSYYETPGLSALEGGLAGANIVITEIGGTRDYFGKDAWYVNPFNLNSIADALAEAYNAKKSDKLANHIKKSYTWKAAAKATLKAYKEIINK
jgi:glycosyltransferase involved in cell wall biosynthesis